MDKIVEFAYLNRMEVLMFTLEVIITKSHS